MERTVLTTQFRGGGAQVVEVAPARWVASYSTHPLQHEAHGRVCAWWDARRGGLESFYAHDPARPYPIRYGAGLLSLETVGGLAFTGAGAVTGLTATTITMTGLPAGLQLVAGDYIGLVQSGLRGLHRLTSDVTASGVGVATATVEPPVVTNVFTTSATYNLVRPVCIMVADPASWGGEFGLITGQVSFGGQQRVM
ncbi:MAG: hypothetical protein AB7E55_31405 [Pigmentiphaga sp.]